MRVLWSADALQGYRQTIAYIADKNPQAAERVARTIETTARQLGILQTGRRGRVGGTYEKVVPGLPFVLGYAIGPVADTESLVILSVIHGARDCPPDQWPK